MNRTPIVLILLSLFIWASDGRSTDIGDSAPDFHVVTSAFDARIPTHVLIDRRGTIRYIEPFPSEMEDLEKILK